MTDSTCSPVRALAVVCRERLERWRLSVRFRVPSVEQHRSRRSHAGQAIPGGLKSRHLVQVATEGRSGRASPAWIDRWDLSSTAVASAFASSGCASNSVNRSVVLQAMQCPARALTVRPPRESRAGASSRTGAWIGNDLEAVARHWRAGLNSARPRSCSSLRLQCSSVQSGSNARIPCSLVRLGEAGH